MPAQQNQKKCVWSYRSAPTDFSSENRWPPKDYEQKAICKKKNGKGSFGTKDSLTEEYWDYHSRTRTISMISKNILSEATQKNITCWKTLRVEFLVLRSLCVAFWFQNFLSQFCVKCFYVLFFNYVYNQFMFSFQTIDRILFITPQFPVRVNQGWLRRISSI